MVGSKVFLVKPKHQFNLSQQGEWVYCAQSWNERRLLRESVFIPIGRWILILKIVESEVFLIKPKHQFIYPNEENKFMVPNHEKKEDYYMNPYLSQLTYKLWF